MSDSADQTPDRICLTYTEEEVWASAKLMARHHDRGPAWDRYWSVIFVVILGVGLMPFAALSLELIRPVSLQPVLITAYAAFVAGGATYWCVMYLRSRNMARAGHREVGSKRWEFMFDDQGFVCRNENIETRIPWRAVERVEDTGALVLIWLNPAQATHLPARVFADAAAREAFVTSTAGRITAAKASVSAHAT